MRQALDDAFADIAEEHPALLAVVLSIDPDATISWAWSSDHEPRRALGFAALHRAATMCLDGLEGEQRLHRLLLSSNASWIASRPLRSPEENGGSQLAGPHYVVTTAFCGDIQPGMAVVKTARLRDSIKQIVDAHAEPQCMELRDGLVELIAGEGDPLACLTELSKETEIGLAELTRLDQLSAPSRQALLAWLRPRLSQ